MKKLPLKRVSFEVTSSNSVRIIKAMRRKRVSKSAVVRYYLMFAFKRFTPVPTFGRITMEGGEPTAPTSYNLPEALINRLKLSALGWRYSESALFNALMNRAFNSTSAKIPKKGKEDDGSAITV